MTLPNALPDTSHVVLLGAMLLTTAISVLGAASSHWVRLPVVDKCYLPLTGGTHVTATSLSNCMMSGVTNQRKVASYDESSGVCTLHDQTTILSTSGDVYVQSPSDCADVNPACSSIIHRITTISGNWFDIFCDMDTAQGPWNLIQNRESSVVDFFRDWAEYKTGFGDLLGNFWLGNDHIRALVEFSPYKLRIQLEVWDGTVGVVEYSLFQIANEAENYRLVIDGFSGNTRDGMTITNGRMFCTKDRDNDLIEHNHCAVKRHGAWWYGACSFSNLNGRYMTDIGNAKYAMSWKTFFDNRGHVPLKKARMLIKRP